MTSAAERRIPGYQADQLWRPVLRYRDAWPQHPRPEDVARLIDLFPAVSLNPDYQLDYLSLGGLRGRWIWPYARPKGEPEGGLPEGLAGIPRDQLASLREGEGAAALKETSLYRYLHRQETPMGLFQYTLFLQELWAFKSEAVAAEWLDLTFLFNRHQFESSLRQEGIPRRLTRPSSLDPIVHPGVGEGGRVEWVVFQPRPRRRVAWYRCEVGGGGGVKAWAGETLVDFG